MIDFITNKGEKIIFDEFSRSFYNIGMQTKQSSSIFNSMQDYYNYIIGIDYLSKAYYNITRACNLNCTYCYSNNSGEQVSIDDNSTILSWLSHMNTKQLSLIGGEPFCHTELENIVNCALDFPCFEEITIITNGTLIRDRHINFLKNERVSLQISLDGFNEHTNSKTRGKGSYSDVRRSMHLLEKYGIQFSVMSTLTHESIENAFDFYLHFKNEGINAGFFMVKQVPDNIKPSNEQLIELLTNILNVEGDVYRVFDIVKFADNMIFSEVGYPITHCGAGINAISIETNGDIFPCVKMSSDEKRIVNIFDECSENIFSQKRRDIINNDLVHQNKKECSSCKIKFFCGGGCRAEENDLQINKTNCDYFKMALEFFAKNVYIEV